MQKRKLQGGANLHQLNLHGHVDGEEHPDGVRLPQDQGVLQREARAGVPGGGHAVGSAGRDDRRAHDHGEKKWHNSKKEETFMSFGKASLSKRLGCSQLRPQALCMNELRGCQKYSMGPNFIYFGAQK